MKAGNRRKNAGLKMGGILIIVFLVIYIPSLLHWAYGNSVLTQLIRMGTIEDSINTEGYIIRDEEVLKSSVAGKCILEVNEGDKVPSNFRIATVLNGSAEGLIDRLRIKDNEIIKSQLEKSKNQELFSEDLVKIDNEIGQRVRQVIQESDQNNLLKVKQLRDEIDRLIKKKAEIFGGTSIADTYINSLKKEKEKLHEQINQNKTDIIVKSPGIISFNIDGYESLLTPSGISKITPKTLDGIKVHEVAQNPFSKNVEKDKPFSKIIKDIEAYIVVVLEPPVAEGFKVDDIIEEVKINPVGYTASGKVDFKSSLMEGKYIIALKVDRGISETAALRKVNIDIVKSSYKGLKVHLKSLKNVNFNEMTALICLVKDNEAKYKEVRINGYNEDFAIIDNIQQNDSKGISLYDTYVVEPENIQEGQVINQ